MAKRVDANQPTIVKALRQAGASVDYLHTLGGGIPDLLVGYRERTFVIEVKNPEQPASKRRLTPDEQEWHDSWRGQKAVVETIEEALKVIGAVK